MRNPSTKRRLGKISLAAALAVCTVIGVRQAVAQVYYIPMASMEPELPRGSRILVYKLAGEFRAGDIVTYRHTSGKAYLGRVESADPATGALVVSRNSTAPITVLPRNIIGRVVLSTR